jgi:hypothetical protein
MQGQSCQEKLVIVTGFEETGSKLSRKACYCDRFQGTRVKAVKNLKQFPAESESTSNETQQPSLIEPLKK